MLHMFLLGIYLMALPFLLLAMLIEKIVTTLIYKVKGGKNG